MIYRQGVLCILRAFSGNCGYTLKIDSIVDQEKKKENLFSNRQNVYDLGPPRSSVNLLYLPSTKLGDKNI